MNSPLGSPHPRSETCKSFRRTLLRRPLHRFSALAPVTHLDGITYRRNALKSRKSFMRLLLSLFVPLSPLCAYSYKKMGVGGIHFSVIFRGPVRPCLNSLNPTSSRPRAARPCLSPLLRYSYRKMGVCSPGSPEPGEFDRRKPSGSGESELQSWDRYQTPPYH
jgi:hypothetical protein